MNKIAAISKVVWTYDYFKIICDAVAEQIYQKAGDTPYQLVAVSRGGVTAAHRIAYKLARPLNFFSPTQRCLAWVPGPDIKHLFFIEDLVAKGRTFSIVKEFMSNKRMGWNFCPLLVDIGYTDHDFQIKGVVSKDWVVFPYEDEKHVSPGDWGLFRDQTANSAMKGKT